MKEEFRKHFSTNLDRWSTGGVSVSERRELIVCWFSVALETFKNSRAGDIVRAHQRCGSALRFNGSENHVIKIEGYMGVINV